MVDDDDARVVIVGYALNAKKLRKSGYDATPHDSRSNGGKGEVWQGGGLADILGNIDAVVEGIQFMPWDPELPPSSQVC